jgi:tetratricopeptide (TPR) repeat protein
LSNRGILASNSRRLADAEQDFRRALTLLEPVRDTNARALQEFGRVSNNLGSLLDGQGRDGAETYYQQAVTAHERLVKDSPENSEYQIELATFSNNLAVLYLQGGDETAALRHNQRVVELLTNVGRPALSLAIERADAYNLRALILVEQDRQAALRAYEDAIDQYREIAGAPAATRMPNFHLRFGDLLVNLALLAKTPAAGAAERHLLDRGLDQFIAVARPLAASGTPAEIQAALDTLTAVMSELDARGRRRVLAVEQDLRRALDASRLDLY